MLGSRAVSSIVGEDETLSNKRGMTAVMPRFVTHLVGLPLPGSPLLFLLPGSLRRRRVGSNPPTYLWRGEGRDVAGRPQLE